MIGRECCRVFCVVHLAESTQSTVIFSNGLDKTSALQTSAPRSSRTEGLRKPTAEWTYGRITGHGNP
jgi:hypothetical protein